MTKLNFLSNVFIYFFFSLEIQSFERQTNESVMDLTNDDGTPIRGPTIQKTKWLINSTNIDLHKNIFFLGIEKRKNLLLLVKMMLKQKK
jgi:hypothetical protein